MLQHSFKFDLHISKLKMFAWFSLLFLIIFGAYFALKVDLAANLFSTSSNDNAITHTINKPDLIIDRVFLDKSIFKAGENISGKIKTLNRGEEKAEKFKIKIVDETGWGTVLKSAIDAKTYKYIEFNLQSLSVHNGRHVFTVVADSGNEIDEFNEQNNSLKFELNIL